MEFYNQSSEKILNLFDVDKNKGLDKNQVLKQRREYGLNEIKIKKKVNPIKIFFSQFKSFIIYILIFAVIITIIAREYINAFVILAILIFNAFFGFIQEYKAEKAIEALKKLSALRSKIIRDGKTIFINSKDLVPGDIIILEEGNKIPADARIIENIGIHTMESSLTGESVPVPKTDKVLGDGLTVADRKNMLFSGTSITRGHGKAVVTFTGMQTEIGKIATLIGKVQKEQTPLQKKLHALGKWIGLFTIIVSLFVFISGVIRDDLLYLLFSGQYVTFILESKTWLLTAVALAVAAVPEGLPVIVTIALALGVRRMLKKNALIRRLPSVETLGCTTVICSDKTGTLTKNEMTVRKAYMNLKEITITDKSQKLKPGDLLVFKIGVLCNNASLDLFEQGKTETSGDPTESALLVSAEKVGLNHKELVLSWKRSDEEPFDTMRKMMSTINKDPKTKKSYVFTKGAPENIIEKCDRILINGKIIKLRLEVRKQILLKNDQFAKKSLRVLAFAYKEHKPREQLESDLIFVGLQGMIDPPRPEVKGSIIKCKQAGIRVMMITGDNRHTAEAIAKEIGIKGESMNGADFSNLRKEEQIKIINKISIFSRVEPKHKMEIIGLLQNQGNVVAMTGDGVNDAPALKKADIGVAMGIKGTDVAKEASDMILQDDNFTSIVNSVEEGRGIYENIKKFINYLLSSNTAEVLVILLAILFGFPLPMTAIMLLWINLVTDGLPALALSVDPNPKDLMKKPPKKAKEKIMNRSMLFNVFYVAILITIAVLGLFYWAMINYADLEPSLFIKKIQTIAFTAIIVMELVRLYTIRSEYKLGIFSNKYLVMAVVASILLQIAVIYTPLSILFGTVFLSLRDWLFIVGATLGVFILNVIGIKIKNRINWFKE